VGPGKKRELSQIVLLHQGEHKPDKAEDVEGKRYQSMVSHQEGEEVYPVDDNTELLHQSLSVEKIVRSDEEVPGERPEPGKVVHFVDGVSDVDNLSKALDLDAGYRNHKSKRSPVDD